MLVKCGLLDGKNGTTNLELKQSKHRNDDHSQHNVAAAAKIIKASRSRSMAMFWTFWTFRTLISGRGRPGRDGGNRARNSRSFQSFGLGSFIFPKIRHALLDNIADYGKAGGFAGRYFFPNFLVILSCKEDEGYDAFLV